MTLWDTVMFAGELDMLECRLTELADTPGYRMVLTEAPVTHRGLPKPLYFAAHRDRFVTWGDQIWHVAAQGLDEDMPPWEREHRQRDAAWAVLARQAADDDVVLIADCDEFPSAEALAWRGQAAASLFMRTMLFAVDWEVPPGRIPPTAVMARMRWLRARGGSLAAVRDQRGSFPVIADGGIHLSWVGGPEAQRHKLETATCHEELLNTAEGELIASGQRWRTDEDGGGLPVRPVDVDETWPRYVRERRCPGDWFRPR